MSADHVATIRRLYDHVNAGDTRGIAGLMADDFTEHEETPGLEPTKDGVIAFFEMQRAAFPDMRMEVEDLFAAGDKAVARVRFTGTHRGPFMGMEPTGRSVDVPLIDMFAFDDRGLLSDHWGVMDSMVMMQQLGVVPDGPPA